MKAPGRAAPRLLTEQRKKTCLSDFSVPGEYNRDGQLIV